MLVYVLFISHYLCLNNRHTVYGCSSNLYEISYIFGSAVDVSGCFFPVGNDMWWMCSKCEENSRKPSKIFFF